MRRLGAVFLILASALSGAACSDGASSDPALSSRMRILEAQFVEGSTPKAQAGPEVLALELLTTTIWPGYADKPVRGALENTATAVALALSGDAGFWLVPAGVPDVSAQALPTFRCTASFARSLPEAAYTLEVRAVDGQGRFGPPLRQTLTALPFAPSRGLAGELLVTLTWDNQADLDLHVVDPLGHEIYHGAPSSVDAFAPGATDESAGILDLDSNADCANDQLRQEDVVWDHEPPSGRYSVRVDSASLCGGSVTHWSVRVTLRGVPLVAAQGTSVDSDTWGPHDRGAGVLALGFDVP
jgi:hypothetical protein